MLRLKQEMQPVPVPRFLNKTGKNEAPDEEQRAEPAGGASAAAALCARANRPAVPLRRDEPPRSFSCPVRSQGRAGRSGERCGRSADSGRRDPSPLWGCRCVRDRTALLGVRSGQRGGLRSARQREQRNSPLSLRKRAVSARGARLPAHPGSLHATRPAGLPAVPPCSARSPGCRRRVLAGCQGCKTPRGTGCSAGCGVCCPGAGRTVQPCTACSSAGCAVGSAGPGCTRPGEVMTAQRTRHGPARLSRPRPGSVRSGSADPGPARPRCGRASGAACPLLARGGTAGAPAGSAGPGRERAGVSRG